MKVAKSTKRREDNSGELTTKYSIHATQINNWKKAVLDVLPEAFSNKRKRQEDDQQNLIDELYRQIGQLKVENEFLKKSFERFVRGQTNVDRTRTFRT